MELFNTNNQLQLVEGINNEFYKFDTMKSFSINADANQDWYVIINFIANDKNNSLRLYVKNITNPSQPNTQPGALALLRIISGWASSNNMLSAARWPYILSTSTTGSISSEVYSFSIYNSGSAAGTVTLSGAPSVSIPAGATVNFDAGGSGFKFYGGSVVYNATGTTFLISYVY
jgi:hypothetical protein